MHRSLEYQATNGGQKMKALGFIGLALIAGIVMATIYFLAMAGILAFNGYW